MAAPRAHRGDGYEFSELREYVAGDDPRRIDWAATARAGTLQTRILQEDRALTLAGALDASPSMGVGRTRSAYDRGLEALAVWFTLALSDDRCARVRANGIVADPHRRGPSAAHVCLAERAEPQRSFTATLQVALATLSRDASLLLVSDFYDIDEAEPALRQLAVRCDVTGLLIADPWRDGLPLAGFVRLSDAETGAQERLFIGRRERERFRQSILRRETAICRRLENIGVRAGVLNHDAELALMQSFGIAGGVIA